MTLIKRKFKRILVKVGTSVITSKKSRLDKTKIRKLVGEIAEIIDAGVEVIIVTSGAIGAGIGILKKSARPQSLPELQACAAIGQNQLMKQYEEFFKKRGYITAQILLTQEDLTDRKRYLNAKNTLLTLLEEKAVPVINENDTVSTDEIKFGDNDRLSSLVASLLKVDLLVMLTDVDGLCQYDQKGKKVKCVNLVEKVTRDVENFALKQKSKSGIGGMVSKLQAAKIATSSGIPCIIANGTKRETLLKIIEGERVGTLFLAHRNAISAKKHWIAYTSKVQGTIKVDNGAKEALVNKQKSLLPSGIIEGEGRFDVGDVVSIIGEENEEFAKGFTNYSSLELRKIMGLKTGQIQSALGYKHYDEVVHRDNLVIL
ncbi:MAG: glutamate 5-kinase [Candidatus Omnitrophica bacterium]|nr:glutamate 5-kinase [Candidatus Omnitrophota bacterium]